MSSTRYSSSRDEEPLGYASMRERQRHHKKYRKRRDEGAELDEEDDKDNEEILPRWKIVTVFAIIGICFAMLFPNLFGPIFSTLFGRKADQPQQASNPHHPFMDRGAGQAPRPPGPSHRGPSRMPHAEIPQSGGRGGMMSWMLPIYTIGVMGFLVYTLFKMNRKKKKKRRRYDEEDESDYSQESDEESENGELGRRKLRSIQNKLRETEEAMAKILEQLEEVAQAAPETLSPDELRNKYTTEQMRQTEFNLQELNRLNELRTRQQRLIEEEGVEDEEPELIQNEDRDDPELSSTLKNSVGDAPEPNSTSNINAGNAPETTSNSKTTVKNKQRPSNQTENPPDQHTNSYKPFEDDQHLHQSDIEDNILGNTSDEDEEKPKLKTIVSGQTLDEPSRLRRRNQKKQPEEKPGRQRRKKKDNKKVNEDMDQHLHQSDIEDNLFGNSSAESDSNGGQPKVTECAFPKRRSKFPESKNKEKSQSPEKEDPKVFECSFTPPQRQSKSPGSSESGQSKEKSQSPENKEPKVFECSFTPPPSQSSVPQKSKKSGKSKSSPTNPLDSTSTAFENQLFGFGGGFSATSQPKKGQQKKDKQVKRVEDYEAPSLLDDLLSSGVNTWGGQQMKEYQEEIKHEAVNRDDKAVDKERAKSEDSEKEETLNKEYVREDQQWESDAKRPLRRAKRKKPFGEDAQRSRIDEAKLQEQRQIVEELSAVQQPTEEVKEESVNYGSEEKEEQKVINESNESPKQSANNGGTGNKSKNKNRKGRVRKAS